MLTIGEPARTAYDVRFNIFGFPVRVSAYFWLAAAIFGQGAASYGVSILFAWIAAMFLSILVHELGHTFAFRQHGISSHIVLYHFGGLAIPNAYHGAWSSSLRRDDPRKDIYISAAGPGLEILSAIALIFLVNLSGYSVRHPLYPVGLPLVSRFLPAQTGEVIPSEPAAFFVYFYCLVSIYWGLLNLLPVQPLDGGKIATSLMRMFFNPSVAVPYSLILSIAVAGLIVIFALNHQRLFLGIMFGLFAYSSFQQLQMYQGPGRW